MGFEPLKSLVVDTYMLTLDRRILKCTNKTSKRLHDFSLPHLPFTQYTLHMHEYSIHKEHFSLNLVCLFFKYVLMLLL